jgi:oligopeptidase A
VKFDNTAIMGELLALRHEEARLLGYRHYADVSLVPKMAESPEQVVAFLRDLGHKARPHAEKDLTDLRAFAASELGLNNPQAWDWPYIGEKLKEARYAFSEQEVKPYFTAPKVLAGLFQIVETLFEVAIRRDQAPVWNPGVEFYRIERARRPRPGTRGPVLPGPGRAHRQTRWCLDGRCACPAGCAPTLARCRPRAPTWCAISPKA